MASGSTPNIGQQVSWVGGISNDQYSGPGNHFRDGRNVDIRTDSRSFGLSEANTSQSFVISDKAMAIIPDTDVLVLNQNGTIDSSTTQNIYEQASGASDDYSNGVVYGNSLLVLSGQYISSFPYTSGQTREDMLWSASIASTPTGWTGAAGWSLDGTTWTHSTGTGTLVDNVGTVTASKYNRIYVNHTGTVGTCTVTCGGTTFGTLNSTNTGGVIFYDTTVSTGKLTFTPSNTYNGAISGVTVYETTMTENKWTFNNTNAKKPYLIFKGNLLIGDGYKIVQLTWNGSTYVPTSGSLAAYTRITIDLTESILGIYELGDQVVFFTDKAQYFRDGFNAAYDRRVPWNETIIATAQDGTSFYVVTKSIYTTLWRCSTGYDRIPVQKDEITNDTVSKFTMEYGYDNSMKTIYGIKLFAGGTQGELNSYGSYNPGMPQSFMKYRTGTGLVTAIGYKESDVNGFVYYGWFSGSTYYVGLLRLTRRDVPCVTGEEGLVVLTPEIGSSEGANKVMEKIRVGYDFTKGIYSKANVYANIDNEQDRWSFSVGNPTVVPTPGATYTYSGNTYTVINVFEGTDGNVYIGTQSNAALDSQGYSGTLTKTGGTGDATLTFTYVVQGRLVCSIDGTDSAIRATKKYPFMFSEPFNKIQFSISLETTNASLGGDPRIFDFIWEYTERDNDL